MTSLYWDICWLSKIYKTNEINSIINGHIMVKFCSWQDYSTYQIKLWNPHWCHIQWRHTVENLSIFVGKHLTLKGCISVSCGWNMAKIGRMTNTCWLHFWGQNWQFFERSLTPPPTWIIVMATWVDTSSKIISKHVQIEIKCKRHASFNSIALAA